MAGSRSETSSGLIGWTARVTRWASWALLLTPLTLVLHEAGHLLAGLVFGLPGLELHFSHVSHGSVADRSALVLSTVGFTGPLVTIALALAGMVWILFRGPSVWAFALVAAAASRLALAAPYTILAALARFRGQRFPPHGFDEYRAAEAMGWSGLSALGVTTAFVATVLVWLAVRLPRGERFTAWIGLLLGVVLGWVLWIGFLGPILLP
ncbi:MAG: hypothetical protein AVDCRST_MAG91-2585 [uncultured Sphingomonadaceae bacterium]|uniref:Peptidase M50 domain-containing protein n=1 Tax=uncultured Sphingomonadaceae bacterium TaxID=169976 RepID=A0A6J4TLI5_9SPHN|nr:MAG: hypothetical protein AVDCRST_MAG91-2585 [uncultured Sphingomonadaceae bacterium]